VFERVADQDPPIMLISSDKVRIRPFKVIPSLPEPLKPLLEIAHNLWWTWHPEAVRLFVRLDRSAWSLFNHNPVRMLGNISGCAGIGFA